VEWRWRGHANGSDANGSAVMGYGGDLVRMRDGRGGGCFGISCKSVELRHDLIKIPHFRMTHARKWMTRTVISPQGKDTINSK
jgi:hypothetical protein